jgi:glycosyltransferase involved in cell wall biosynthesis
MIPVLFITYEYPPCHSAGVQRILKFTEHLPALGFKPIVLTTTAFSYRRTDENLSIPPQVEVYRTPSLDVSRHLSIKGKYFDFLATPDRYSSWFPGARLKANYILRKHQPRLIFSSFPFISNHMLAMSIAKKSGIPLIAEYRDPAPFHYNGGKYNKQFINVDRDTIQYSKRVIFATGKMQNLYESLFPSQKSKFSVIENGFNEAVFNSKSQSKNDSSLQGQITILHSGAIYDEGRNPLPLIKALHQLISTDKLLESDQIKITFRGSNPFKALSDYIDKYDLHENVHFKKPISYEESIGEMLDSDILFLLQGELFKYQIPGKAYEYLAANKAILALSPQNSATNELMQPIDGVYTANDDNIAEIKQSLLNAISECRSNLITRDLSLYSRHARSIQLANLFEQELRLSGK